jgi:hypothetical protein
MSPTNLSRRAILAGAAAVPALALPAVIVVAAPNAAPPAVVVAAPPTDPVIALAERAIEAWDTHGAAIDAFAPFDEAMFKWRDKNLRPATRRLEGSDISSSVAGLTEAEQRVVRILRVPAAEYEARDRDYRAAVAKWERRERAAQRRTGFTKADANATAAGRASRQAMETLRDTLPQSFAGVAAKARAARHLKDDMAEELMDSLARDIGVMSGEIEREAVQS